MMIIINLVLLRMTKNKKKLKKNIGRRKKFDQNGCTAIGDVITVADDARD